jgi:hypothetical protein
MKNHRILGAVLMGSLMAATVLLVVPGGTYAQEVQPTRENVAHDKPNYSPFVGRFGATRVFWGDTHLHTSNSPDAGFSGNTLGPEMAYRFARGEEVTSSTGQRVQLVRPLDFLVVSDHAEYYGLPVLLKNRDPVLLSDPVGKRWLEMSATQEGAHEAFMEIVNSAVMENPEELVENPAVKRSIWERYIETADEYDEPGRFTAFIGFEWSSAPRGGNLHRVVIFRDGADYAQHTMPYSLFDSEDPEDLWDYMAAYEERTGGRMLTLAHNGNWSNGLMFQLERMNGRPFDRAYAEKRMRWEPIYEVTQIKGDGETHPYLTPDDEFADFEPWDKADVSANEAKRPEMLQFEYAREALKNGLAQEGEIGVNPFKFGMVGSTDSHTSLATSREDNYFGKVPYMEPTADRWEKVLISSQTDPRLSSVGSESGAAGLAAVWARENTREAIFDAMMRKEVYATTGSRILVRVFAGWDFEADEVEHHDFAQLGYARGVPMGGDLTNAPAGKAPTFMIRALRDPDNANLDRVQIIKGWVDASGETHERIYDVAVSDGRTIGPDGRCRTPVGSTVDVANDTYTNTIGDPLLTAYWVDPDFDPSVRAFYYVRVIEIPKPRWSAYDAAYFNVDMPEHVRMVVQDRAYTSPIWYTPGM